MSRSFWEDGQPKFVAQSKEGLYCTTAVIITIIICVTVLVICK